MPRSTSNPEYPFQVEVSGFDFRTTSAVIIEGESYRKLIGLLTPEQKEILISMTKDMTFVGFQVRVNNSCEAIIEETR